jgi:hypothetical protein
VWKAFGDKMLLDAPAKLALEIFWITSQSTFRKAQLVSAWVPSFKQY